ncbi:MAG: hypothetical protein EHM40_22265 [Chloroflexi bacterium]|nr:MAG: hypothetical protein EHM40_22265 [Chloroflexota bacterium]
MTIIALILSILLGTASLAMGYSQAGATDYPRWFLLLSVLWLIAHFRKWYWFSSIALLILISAAAYGVWQGFPTVWMLLGAVGGLLGWDLSDFARRLGYAAPMDDTRGMERQHLLRVGIVAALGLGLALLSVFVHFQRLAFEVAVVLVLLAALGLTRLVIGLRKY